MAYRSAPETAARTGGGGRVAEDERGEEGLEVCPDLETGRKGGGESTARRGGRAGERGASWGASRYIGERGLGELDLESG